MCDHGGGDTKATLAAIGLTSVSCSRVVGVRDQGLKALPPHERLPPSTSTLTKRRTRCRESPLYEQKLLLAQQKPDGSYDYHKPENVPLYNGMVLEKGGSSLLG